MEMLLVTALAALVGAAVFQSFGNGLRLWARGTQIDHEGDVAIAIDKLGEDLRSAMVFSNIPFKGREFRVSFASMVSVAADRHSSRSNEVMADQIGAIEYYFDPQEGAVFKRQANYGQALKDKWGEPQQILGQVTGLTFRYYYLDGKKLVDRAEADQDVPVGISAQISLGLQADGRSIKRYFVVPMGG